MKRYYRMKFTILLLIFISIIKGVDIPTNSSGKMTISNWTIAKEINFDSKQSEYIMNNYEDYIKHIKKENVRKINLANYNDVTIALYQLFDDIDFTTTFIATCTIESNTRQLSGFEYNDYDLDANVYINGKNVICWKKN